MIDPFFFMLFIISPLASAIPFKFLKLLACAKFILVIIPTSGCNNIR